MTAFDDILKADAAAFTNTSEFGETVVYVPGQPTTANPKRTINALVTRHPPRPMNSDPAWKAPKLIVQVMNDATLGISSAQLDTTDRIVVAEVLGQTADPRGLNVRMADGVGMDTGMLTLELR